MKICPSAKASLPLDFACHETSCSSFKCGLELRNEVYSILRHEVYLYHALHSSLACLLYYCCCEIRHRSSSCSSTVASCPTSQSATATVCWSTRWRLTPYGIINIQESIIHLFFMYVCADLWRQRVEGWIDRYSDRGRGVGLVKGEEVLEIEGKEYCSLSKY